MEHKEYKKLHAEWYDLMSDQMDYSKELNFWMTSIEKAGGPVLELGSGTGRVLIPLLEHGIRVIGIDTSQDMMARCLTRCEAKGLRAELYEQSMLEFSLPMRFGLVFLGSGSLSLFVFDQDINAMFAHVMAHLKPGGIFIYGFETLPPNTNKDSGSNIWGRWEGDWLKGPDDVVIAWRRRYKYDPITHVWVALFVVEKFIRGSLVETEANERVGRNFSLDEARQYAILSGFEDVTVINLLTGEAPNKEDGEIVIRCRKPMQTKTITLITP